MKYCVTEQTICQKLLKHYYSYFFTQIYCPVFGTNLFNFLTKITVELMAELLNWVAECI